MREAATRARRRCEWSVLVFISSETRGEWDVGVRGPHGQRFALFRGEPADLPHLLDVADPRRAGGQVLDDPLG